MSGAASVSHSHSGVAPMLTDEERQIYDRQLRVWGVDAQKRMRDSRVLLIGMSGLNCEVGKNLVLAGIGHLTLLDGHDVKEEDLAANFLLTQVHVGRNRALASIDHLRALNPNVEIEVVARSLADVLSAPTAAATFFQPFRAICMVGQTIQQQTIVNELLRKQYAESLSSSSSSSASSTPTTTAVVSPPTVVPTAFFSGEVFGLWAYFFEDLVRHSYTQAKIKKDEAGNEEETIEAGEKVYRRTVSDLYNSSIKYSELQKAFGKKKQEKAACQLWINMRTVQTWRGDRASYPLLEENEKAAIEALTAAQQQILKSLTDAPAAGVADMEQIRTIANNAEQDLSHICAVVGGILGQEILKVVSGKDEPLSNLFVFSAQEGFGIMKEI